MSIKNKNVVLPKVLAWGILVFFLLGSIIAFVFIRSSLKNQGKIILQDKVQLIQQIINDSFLTFAIRQPVATRALFDASDFVSAEEFHTFYESRDIRKNFPGISYVGFSRYVKNNAKENLVREMRLQSGHGLESFNVFPKTENNFIAPIVYFEPDEKAAAAVNTAIGFDILSETNRREAVNKAIDSGEFVLSDKVTVHPSGKSGFIGYLAVYSKKITASSTVEERRSNVYGIVSTVFETDSLFGNFSGAITSLVLENLDIEVFENENISEEGLLYDYFPTKEKIIILGDLSSAIKSSLFLGGEEFTLVVASSGGMIQPASRIMPYLVLVIGITVGFLLFTIFYLLGSLYIRAYKLADDMTENFRASEERYRSLFMESKDAIMTSTPEAGFLSGNPAAIKLFGCRDEKEFLSKTPYDLSPEYQPDGILSKQKALKMMNLALNKGSAFFEWTHKKTDGTEFSANVLLSRIELRGKKFLQATVRDISAQKKAEETIMKITADLEKFKLAVANANDQIIITDAAGKIIFANKGAEIVTGYKIEELMGNTPGLWGGQMSKEFYADFYKTIRDKKQVFRGEVKNKRKDGGIYDARIGVSPILNKKGDVEFFVDIERDISKEKEIDRAKTEFVSLASHQLRTPLSIISWYTEVLLKDREKNLSKKEKKYLTEIYRGNKRMIDLVNALLNVSRIDLGTIAVEPVSINLADLADDILKDFIPQIKTKKIKLEKEYSKNLLNINADLNIMRMVLQNLISNAVKYTTKGGRISVKISKEEKNFTIEVSNTGYGIPKNQQDKIFTKLFRADNAREIDPEGNGLG
ncbi:MAG: CHASE domain-containing protein, partial [Candidatus Pacebacteria bacterium]|nr:CHASE domain-containing protein [Candidatus Paceibacterota bacterium]